MKRGIHDGATVNIRLHPHAQLRLAERFPAKYDRQGFRRNFAFDGEWRGRYYATRQVEAYAVEEDGWLVISLITRYF